VFCSAPPSKSKTSPPRAPAPLINVRIVLQDENHRLYSIIERMQNKNSSSERDSAVAEADQLSKKHDKDRDGNVALVKQLETQNVKLQEEISKLSDQAISLQNLSSRCPPPFPSHPPTLSTLKLSVHSDNPPMQASVGICVTNLRSCGSESTPCRSFSQPRSFTALYEGEYV